MGFVGGDGILAHSDRDEPTRPRRVANVDLSVVPSLPVFIAVRRLTTDCRGSSRPGWRPRRGGRHSPSLGAIIIVIDTDNVTMGFVGGDGILAHRDRDEPT